MIPAAVRQGLKEWAVAVEALRVGRQILLLRKGGLGDPEGGFRAAHREFFLFPTFEHQDLSLLKPEEAIRYRSLLAPEAEHGPLLIGTLAVLVEAVAVEDAARARRLQDHHLWNEAYVEMRLAYKPERPLQALLLRAYALSRPLLVPRHPRYAGCRSWLEFEEELSTAGARPALDDRAFAERVARVKGALGG